MPVLYFCVSIEDDFYVGERARFAFPKMVELLKNEPDVGTDRRATGDGATVMRANPLR